MSNSQQEPVKAQNRTADHSTLNDKVFVEAQDLGLAICGLAVQGRAGQGRAGQGRAGRGLLLTADQVALYNSMPEVKTPDGMWY